MTLRPGQRIKCVKWWNRRHQGWYTLSPWVLRPAQSYILRNWLSGKVTYEEGGTPIPVQVVYHPSPASFTEHLRTIWEAQPF